MRKVGSIPEPKTGDWLEHEAFGKTGRRRAKRAEVITISSSTVSLYLVGEPGFQTVQRSDITRWWNTFLPPDDPSDVAPPSWLQEGKEFYVTDSRDPKRPEYHAIIRIVRGTWVSFIEQGPDHNDVFRLMPYQEFSRVGWQAIEKLSVWEWLRRPLV